MDKEEGLSGSFSAPFSEDFNSHLLPANHRLHHITPQTKEQEELMETLMKLPAIGLKLQISPALLKQMQRSTQSKRKRIKRATQARTDNDGQRLKASILGALMLQIGSWQVVAKNEGDLVAKFYFAKRQLVWEILRNGLKEKIEIEWSNIMGIQALMEENKPGILEVELHHPPKFYKEIEPEPLKRTQWTDGSDFTGGQASINRRHCIVFPARVLEKHYEKLLDKDRHLFELSRKPFPTFNSHYFPSAAVLNQISFPLHLAAGAIETSPRSVVDYTPHFNEIISQQQQRVELRMYEAEASANYYNEGKSVNWDHQDFYTANPMASMGWLAQVEAAPNFSHQESSILHHIDCFNGTVVNMRAPQVSSGQLCNYPTDSNVL